jgi:hypothetical protein
MNYASEKAHLHLIYFTHIRTQLIPLFNGQHTTIKLYLGYHRDYLIDIVVRNNIINLNQKKIIFNFRRWLPYFKKVCSAELLNHKVMVPCDPVEYLNAEYGVDRWQEPKTSLSKSVVSLKVEPEKEILKKKEYTWPNLKFYRKYMDEEAFNARWYFQNSSIDYGTNIGYINRRLSKKLNEKEIREIIDNEPIIY